MIGATGGDLGGGEPGRGEDLWNNVERSNVDSRNAGEQRLVVWGAF